MELKLLAYQAMIVVMKVLTVLRKRIEITISTLLLVKILRWTNNVPQWINGLVLHVYLTMYIKNRRNSSKFKSLSPLQSLSKLIAKINAIAYFSYTNRWIKVVCHSIYNSPPPIPKHIINYRIEQYINYIRHHHNTI